MYTQHSFLFLYMYLASGSLFIANNENTALSSVSYYYVFTPNKIEYLMTDVEIIRNSVYIVLNCCWLIEIR